MSRKRKYSKEVLDRVKKDYFNLIQLSKEMYRDKLITRKERKKDLERIKMAQKEYGF